MTFEIDTVDNDMGTLLGKVFYYHSADTFDLKDIDPQSVRIEDSCKPVDTPSGPAEPWNCEDKQGKMVVLQTVDAKPKIHHEGHGSSAKSMYGYWQVSRHDKFNLDEMCKEATANGYAGNGAYCDQPDTKEAPKNSDFPEGSYLCPVYTLPDNPTQQQAEEALSAAEQECRGEMDPKEKSLHD